MRYISQVNGTRQFGPSGDGSKVEFPRGKAAGKSLHPLPHWMADPRRKCRDKPTAWWYPPERDEGDLVIDEAGAADAKANAAEAERLCGLCPFNLDCSEHALRHEGFGRWGRVKLPMNAANRAKELAAIDRERRRRIA